MNKNRRWRRRILGGLQVLAAAAIAAAVFYLLCRYVQYGEQAAPVAGTSSRSETSETEFTKAELAGNEELPGTESDGDAKQPGTDPNGDAKQPGTESDGGAKLPETIRVQILDSELTGSFHSEIKVSCKQAFTVKLDGKRIQKGKSYALSASELREGQLVELCPKDGALLTVESLKRADGHPRYAGTLFLYREVEGIVLVNELPLEEYLCGVVSSEMPSDYPIEAQKAQAVCARTYARNCIRNVRGKISEEAAREETAKSPQESDSTDPQGEIVADLDDSVSYQVYNNYRATELSRQAVKATEGEILPLEEIRYYSTSCQSEHRKDLESDEAFREFLAQEPDAGAEYDSPWLRWETEISAEDILNELASRYGWQAERIDEIRVTKREGNGQVTELEVRCGGSAQTVSGEYAIRQLLSPEGTALCLRDGEKQVGMPSLPSAFFWLETVRRQEIDAPREPDLESEMTEEAGEKDLLSIDGVVIRGGGYGHGSGMSQYGAAALAKKGLDYREILEYYYGAGVISR